ncbi:MULTISPECIES: alkaline phosphatase family protein [unclassified Kitasatospora]|uniref:alkaline phosphatase family protein n=1 Tax=unclassified Kitasatospora TaxID=2633591 RepID=UPI00070E896D|nr:MULTISPECIES: alkaline phosphatase family protein [unclassified Kitasatospora]KQV17473.1 acid phosphatase [Kitasatospora sp. Root107]KRB69279.1 acid phosphatase [Kitasatospora sp. Root187]
MLRVARLRSRCLLAAALVGVCAAAGCGGSRDYPAPDHVVVVVFENKAYERVIGSPDAPYLNGTIKDGGANLTEFHAETHPSQPNYFVLFSGSKQGITTDDCVPARSLDTPNLASELIAARRSWASYNEAMPREDPTVCESGGYVRRHNPWFAFRNVPSDTAHTMDEFPSDYRKLPKVSFVIPDVCNDMHNCPISTGDTWLKEKLGGYAAWARQHDSLLVITFDEDDAHSGNHIPTLVYGAGVRPGSSSASVYGHTDLLRTLEELAGLTTHAGRAAGATRIVGIWD